MKNFIKSASSFAMVLIIGTVALSAQSCAVVDHASKSIALSAAASGDASAAVVESTAGVVSLASGVVAVPVWMSGTALTGSGALVTAVGESATQTAGHLWDFSQGNPGQRPALNRDLGLPPAKAIPTGRRDPSPADALKTKL